MFRVSTAYNVLSDKKKRQNYDKWLHSGLAIPYKDWKNRRVENSLHWGNPAPKKLKLKNEGRYCLY